MARTALAYQQPMYRPQREQWPEQRPGQRPEKQLQVLPGKGRQAQELQALAPTWQKLFVVALVVVFAVGAIWIARVSLSESTMSMLAQSEQVSEAIAAQRMAGTQLEVKYSQASNPITIQEMAANKLGMKADEHVEYLRVAPGE